MKTSSGGCADRAGRRPSRGSRRPCPWSASRRGRRCRSGARDDRDAAQRGLVGQTEARGHRGLQRQLLGGDDRRVGVDRQVVATDGVVACGDPLEPTFAREVVHPRAEVHRRLARGQGGGGPVAVERAVRQDHPHLEHVLEHPRRGDAVARAGGVDDHRHLAVEHLAQLLELGRRASAWGPCRPRGRATPRRSRCRARASRSAAGACPCGCCPGRRCRARGCSPARPSSRRARGRPSVRGATATHLQQRAEARQERAGARDEQRRGDAAGRRVADHLLTRAHDVERAQLGVDRHHHVVQVAAAAADVVVEIDEARADHQLSPRSRTSRRPGSSPRRIGGPIAVILPSSRPASPPSMDRPVASATSRPDSARRGPRRSGALAACAAGRRRCAHATPTAARKAARPAGDGSGDAERRTVGQKRGRVRVAAVGDACR